MAQRSGPLRVGIYNRWIQTMGGAEKYSGAVAEALAARHHVDLLTHHAVDLGEIGHHLNLDLRNVRLRLIPDDAGYRGVIRASGDYDLFVNASHQDYFRPRARHNVLVVYFPAPTLTQAAAMSTYNRAKGTLIRHAKRLTGERALGVMRRLTFGHVAQSSDQTLLGRLALRGFGLMARSGPDDQILDAYEPIVAISEFTRGWIQRYWDRDCVVIYPPVDVATLESGVKRDQILSVGRFFAGSHNKKQIELVRAFYSSRLGPEADWQLHLAGGYQPTGSSAAYLAALEREVGADPTIQLHVNCDRLTLRRLYAESKIFWHATGLGEDVATHPERFEHFGITTVEAMAAGCVPVVLGQGGQPEIIRSGSDGILCSDVESLIAETTALTQDEGRRCQIAAAAQRRAHAFSRAAFEQRLDDILAPLELHVGGR